ncbi:MAG: ABC transporter permease [Bryobacteraceae bacterium]
MRYRHVLRRLARTPGFTAITVLTLALGIGANTAIFSVIEGVLLKPLPYPHSEQLIGLWHTAPGVHIAELNMAPSLYFTYREQSHSFQDVGLWDTDSDSVTGHGEPEQTPSLDVTDGTLPLLGVRPALGRLFSLKDCQDGSPGVVILTYGYWQSHFGGAPSAIGQSLMINARPREIVGVLPQSFRFLDYKPQLILPYQFDRANVHLGQFSFSGMARLKPGVSIDQASGDAARMIPIAMSSFPAPTGYSAKMFSEARIAPILRPLLRDVTGDIGDTLWILMGTIGIVLLIACANVANLLLVRAGGRQQELAVRAALGASWGEIARELMTESMTLGALGGMFGLGLAYAGLRLLVAMAPAHLPRLDDISIDGPVLLFTLVVSSVAGALFGAIPVLKYAGPTLVSELRGGGRTLSQSRERHRARNVLVIAQVALAMVLLIAAGLTIRSFQALHGVQPGFTHPEQIQTLRIFIPQAQIKEPVEVVRQQQEILNRIAAIPGVSSAGLTTVVPLDGMGWHDPIYAQDKTYAESTLPPIRRFKFVSPGLLATMGTPLVAGRDFSWTDVYQKRPVAMVSENVARELWQTPTAALGKRIRQDMKSPWREVVGVVGDLRDDGIDRPVAASAYWPVMMDGFGGDQTFISRATALMIRTSRAGTESLLSVLRRTVWSVNPNLPLASVRTMGEIYEKSLARTSFTLVMLAIAGGMALALGMIGLYGTISYSVAQRTREIGIRMAMGAQRGTLTGMFLRHGLALSAIGIACGLASAAVVTRAMKSLLFEVKPVDPLTFALAPAALIASALLASYLPALRATTVDPLEALRAD